MRYEKAVQTSGEWEHILLLGCDSQKVGDYERSDTMIVASINGDGEARLTSIMRDIWVDIPGHGEGKINAAVVYGGPELAMRVVSECLDLPIDKYAMVNMKGMVKLIDLLGGVDLEISEIERLWINFGTDDVLRITHSRRVIRPLKHSGPVHLCGAQAVEYARDRTTGADFRRTERQRQLLKALAQKVRTKKSLPRLIHLAIRGRKWVRTNLELPEILRLAPLALRLDPDGIGSFRIPAEGTYTVNSEGIWRFETDLEKNRQLLREFLKSGGGNKAEPPLQNSREGTVIE